MPVFEILDQHTGSSFDVELPDGLSEQEVQDQLQRATERITESLGDTGQTGVEAAAASGARGAASVASGAVKGAGSLVGLVPGLEDNPLLASGRALQDATEGTFPIDPEHEDTFATKAAGAVGQGIGQLGLFAATGGSSAAVLGAAGLQGAASGAETADALGATGFRKAIMTVGFGAVEGTIERLGGLGTPKFLEPKNLAGKLLGTPAIEGVEEGLTGAAQAALSKVAPEDPNRPGYAPTGVKIPDVFDLKARGEEALLGAIGATPFVAAQLVGGRKPKAQRFATVDGKETDVTDVPPTQLAAMGISPDEVRTVVPVTPTEEAAIASAPTQGSQELVEAIVATEPEVPDLEELSALVDAEEETPAPTGIYTSGGTETPEVVVQEATTPALGEPIPPPVPEVAPEVSQEPVVSPVRENEVASENPVADSVSPDRIVGMQPTDVSVAPTETSPQLALRFDDGTNVRAVQSVEEASKLWQEYRDREGLGSRGSPHVTVVNAATGETVARISYNGRIWPAKPTPREGAPDQSFFLAVTPAAAPQLTPQTANQVVREMFQGQKPSNISFVNERDTQTPAGQQWKGRSQNGQVTINLAHITSAAELKDTIQEELIHNIYEDPEVQSSIAVLEANLPEDVRAEVQSYPREEQGEEAVARLVARIEKTAPALWTRFLEAVRRVLRSLGITPNQKTVREAASQVMARAMTASPGERGATRYSQQAMGEEVTTSTMNAARAIRTLGSNFYSQQYGQVAVRELYQNAFDAVKARQKAYPSFEYAEIAIESRNLSLEGKEYIQVLAKDNGTGMTPWQVFNHFLPAFVSGKADVRTAGGFGLAKMLLLGDTDFWKIETTAQTPEGVLKTTVIGSREAWLDYLGQGQAKYRPVMGTFKIGELEVTIETDVDEEIGTTYVGISESDSSKKNSKYFDLGGVLSDPRTIDLRDASNRGHAGNSPEEFVRNADVTRGAQSGLPIDRLELGTQRSVPGADVTIYYDNNNKSEWSDVKILNNGNPQFDVEISQLIPDSSRRVKVPQLYVELNPTVGVEDKNYPYTKSRDNLQGAAKRAVQDFLVGLVGAAKEAETQDLQNVGKRYKIQTLDGEEAEVVGVFKGVTPEELDTVAKHPGSVKFATMIKRLDGMLDDLRETYGRFHLSGISLNPRSYGFRYGSSITKSDSDIFFNLPAMLSGEEGVVSRLSPDHIRYKKFVSPQTAFAQVFYGVLHHEVSHQISHQEGEGHAREMTFNAAAFVGHFHEIDQLVEELFTDEEILAYAEELSNLNSRVEAAYEYDIQNKIDKFLSDAADAGKSGDDVRILSRAGRVDAGRSVPAPQGVAPGSASGAQSPRTVQSVRELSPAPASPAPGTPRGTQQPEGKPEGGNDPAEPAVEPRVRYSLANTQVFGEDLGPEYSVEKLKPIQANVRAKFFDGSSVGDAQLADKVSQAWNLVRKLAEPMESGSVVATLRGVDQSDATLGVALSELANFAARIAKTDAGAMLNFIRDNADNFPAGSGQILSDGAFTSKEAARALRARKDYSPLTDAVRQTLVEKDKAADKTLGVGVTQAVRRELGKPVTDEAGIEQALAKPTDKKGRTLSELVQKTTRKTDSALKKVAKELAQLPGHEQRDPAKVKGAIEKALEATGVPPAKREAAVKALTPTFQKHLADTREKQARKLLEGRKGKPVDIERFIKAIRLGAVDPSKDFAEDIAKKNGWKGFTQKQFERLEELDRLMSDPETPLHQRELAREEMGKMLNNSINDPNFATAMAEFYRNNALSGITTAGLQIWNPLVTIPTRILSDGIQGLATGDIGRFTASLTAAAEGAKRAISEFKFSLRTDAYTFKQQEVIALKTQLPRMLQDGLKDLKSADPLTKLKGALKTSVGATDWVRRLYASLDQASQSVVSDWQKFLATRAYFKQAGFSPKLIGQLIEGRRAAYERFLAQYQQQGLSDNTASVYARDKADAAFQTEVVQRIGPEKAEAVSTMARNEAELELGTHEGEGHYLKMFLEFAQGFRSAAGDLPYMMVFGFPSTGLKILARSAWWSPYGLIRFWRAANDKKRIASGDLKAEQFRYQKSLGTDLQHRQRIAETTIGSMGAMILVALLKNELEKKPEDRLIEIHSTGPSDHNQRRAWLAAGNSPQTIQIRATPGGRKVSIPFGRSGLENFAVPLNVLGSFFDSHEPTNKDSGFSEQLRYFYGGILAATGRQFAGPVDLFNILQGKPQALTGRNLSGEAAFRASAFVPFSSFLKTWNRLDDARDQSSVKASVLAQIPIAGPSLTEPALNVLGDPISNTPNEWTYKLALPLHINADTEDRKLYAFLTEKGVMPPAKQRKAWSTIYGEQDDETWRKFTEIRGELIKQRIRDNMTWISKLDREKLDSVLDKFAQAGDARARNQLKLKAVK